MTLIRISLKGLLMTGVMSISIRRWFSFVHLPLPEVSFWKRVTKEKSSSTN